jgi:hypothetical protein
MYTNPKNRKNICLKFQCTAMEKRWIEVCAKKAGQAVSRYLHEMILIDYPGKTKVIPPDAQACILQLMEVAALLHPLSRKRLDGDDFNALERAEAREVIRQLLALIENVKKLIP